jgi:hypothetical protein
MRSEAEIQLSIADLRGSERFDARVSAGIRRSGSVAIPAVVTDLSATGFRVEADERLPVDSVVWLKLGTLAPQMARVMWNRKLVAGCQFGTPLNPYVLEQFVAVTGPRDEGSAR